MSHRKARWTTVGLSLGVMAAGAALAGCEMSGFFDPTQPRISGRTPIVLPILNAIDVLDEYEPYTNVTEVQPLDLIPEVREYVVGPNDVIQITIYDLVLLGQPDVQQRVVDELGNIRLPAGIGTVQVAGRTPSQIEKDIAQILQQKNILQDPTVSVMMLRRQQNIFSIIGEPRQGNTLFGQYEIPKPDFRLLDAIAMARGISGNTRTLYIYRTVPLTPEAAGERPSEPVEPGLGDLPEEAARSPEDLIGDLESALQAPPTTPGGRAPEVDDRGDAPPAALEHGLDSGGPPRWVFVGDKWVKVQEPARAPEGMASAMDELVTQRVIAVPYDRLLAGDMRYNIVIRPGDIIKVPAQFAGNVYVSGNVNRPGTYTLPGEKDLTIKSLLAAAGGFGALAVPERAELIRRIGEDQEAIVRIDLRKIELGTQPDIFLKPNDHLRVGTNPFALPLAVARNGFRMTYGFGFVLDRNFGPDVFDN